MLVIFIERKAKQCEFLIDTKARLNVERLKNISRFCRKIKLFMRVIKEPVD